MRKREVLLEGNVFAEGDEVNLVVAADETTRVVDHEGRVIVGRFLTVVVVIFADIAYYQRSIDRLSNPGK